VNLKVELKTEETIGELIVLIMYLVQEAHKSGMKIIQELDIFKRRK
jgi:hypothetical protein